MPPSCRLPLAFLSASALAIRLLTAAAAAEPQVVVVDSSGSPIRSAEIRAQGAALSVTAPGYLPWSGTVPAGGRGPLRVVLLRPAAVRGRVLALGTPLAGARVAVKGDLPEETAKAGSPIQPPPSPGGAPGHPGLFAIKDLPPGLHRLIAQAEGYIPREAVVGLREGETRWLDLELRPASWLDLTVLDGEGKPLRGFEARVRTEDPDGRFIEEQDKERLAAVRAASDETGKLRLGPLGRGVRHRVVLRRERFAPLSLVLVPETPVIRREARPTRGGTLRLALRGPGDRPIPRATASLASDDAADLDLVSEPPPSADDGALAIAALPPGTYSLRLRARGFKPRTLRDLVVRPGALTDGGKVLLEPGHAVAGAVRDDDGKPIKGAEVIVRFYEEGRRLTGKDSTTAEGRFRVEGLPDGEAEVQAKAAGCFSEDWERVAAGVEDLALTLPRSGAIAGRLTDARTGLPVTVFSVDPKPGHDPERKLESWRSPTTRTSFEDPEGHFKLDGLRPQKYDLTIKARGYRSLTLDGIDARPGDPEELSARLEPGLALEGTVLDAGDGHPVADASVRTEGLPSVESDADGRFRLEGLEGKVTLWVDHPAYLMEVVPLADPDRRAPVEIRLRRGGAVEGTVLGEGGEPLPGAVVSEGSRAGERSARTDAAGRYRLEGLAAGERILTKVDVPDSLRGYETAVVLVAEGQTVVHDFGRGIRLYGRVTHNGTPASGAILTLAQSLDQAPQGRVMPASSAVTREDGSFEAHGLRPGTFGLRVTWEDRKMARLLTLDEGETERRLDLDIPDLWIGGDVVDKETRAPLRGRVMVEPRIDAPHSSGSGWMGADGEVIEYSTRPQVWVETDAAGNFRVPLIEPGVYRVDASVDGYNLNQAVEIEVKASRNDLLLEMAPAIELVVRAVEAASRAPLRPQCVGWRSEGNNSQWCGSDVGRMSALRPGSGMATATVPGYAPAYENLTLVKGPVEVTIRFRRAGTIRLLLPAGTGNDRAAIDEAGLRVEDAGGVDVLNLPSGSPSGDPWIVPLETGDALLRDIPPGTLRVSIGGEGTSLPLKGVTVELPEGGEATADLR